MKINIFSERERWQLGDLAVAGQDGRARAVQRRRRAAQGGIKEESYMKYSNFKRQIMKSFLFSGQEEKGDGDDRVSGRQLSQRQDPDESRGASQLACSPGWRCQRDGSLQHQLRQAHSRAAHRRHHRGTHRVGFRIDKKGFWEGSPITN